MSNISSSMAAALAAAALPSALHVGDLAMKQAPRLKEARGRGNQGDWGTRRGVGGELDEHREWNATHGKAKKPSAKRQKAMAWKAARKKR